MVNFNLNEEACGDRPNPTPITVSLTDFTVTDEYIITTNTQTQPEKFQEILQISTRFPGFPRGKIIPVDFQEC